jgi:hypothetical protein
MEKIAVSVILVEQINGVVSKIGRALFVPEIKQNLQ